MVILDVAPDQVDSLVAELEALDLQVHPSTFRRRRWPAPASSSASWPSSRPRSPAADLIDELEQRLPDFADPLTINVNGCPNSCARIQTADIGLKGQLVIDDDGKQVEGFQIHLGGSLGVDSGFGRKVRGLKTTAEALPDYVERVAHATSTPRGKKARRFADWVAARRRGGLS